VAQAVAIKDGRIVYVGGDAGAKAFTGPATRTIDLNGGVVMPGLIDAHMHPLEGGSGLLACDLHKRLTVPNSRPRSVPARPRKERAMTASG
jgi:predicted amidohydrolase YtcJ